MKITTFLQNLAGGGAERVAVLLMNGLAERHEVTLMLARREGPYIADLDPRIKVEDLGGKRTFSSIVPLAKFLRSNRPDVLVSHLTHVNVAAALAVRLSMTSTPLVAVEHNQMGLNYERLQSRAVRAAYHLIPLVYPRIDRVVTVSDGVGASVREFSKIGPRNFLTINNPVVTPRVREMAADTPAHPWLSDGGAPVILGCGRLVEQKDFENLINAFARVRSQRLARLLILGEGEKRDELVALVDQLDLTEDVALPGFDRNPFAAMRAAKLFVLSSRWEGLPTVLIEALASGAVVAATDCPSGPDEVLKGGELGPLVPVANAEALANGIIEALDNPVPSEKRLERANDYTVESAVLAYEHLFSELVD
ncbi:glycosyltransferase [Sphingobium sp. AS12]|uniref:glycosyltransferase n=1 Tax=Sphingobium sp. AS12 TaxID=2849495 RepID=UPI001C314934|nr:glycosyltransferase [Sphingobium sp. AS12]MBV2149730.1 glycosyltransferase [Sphingobium sp. AS12]